jgi:SWI/SNF-related matrix-associated actin-dependent regulator of chromatin subfamily A3
VSGINGHLISSTAHLLLKAKSPVPAQLLSSTTFAVDEKHSVQGNIDSMLSPLVQALIEETAVSLQVRCTLECRTSGNSNSRGMTQFRTPCKISIILYGPNELFDDIGNFFEEYDICLEDPKGCDRNVLYRNPHRLSSVDIAKCLFTWDLDKREPVAELRDLPAPKDLLEDFNNTEDLPETEQPSGLRTQLGR